MKTAQILAAIAFATGIITVNAQTNLATSTITSRGFEAGTLGNDNTFFGKQAGNSTTASGTNNTFVGQNAGSTNITGDYNVLLGSYSGGNSSGNENTQVGYNTGSWGDRNTALGSSAGFESNGSQNVYIGHYSGGENQGSNNTFLGFYAGYGASGNGNVFLGKEAGSGYGGNDKLFIDNSESLTPLIWGDFANDLLKFNGKVGIGLGTAAFPTTGGSINVAAYKLIVNGGILAKEVRVATTWADYVFEDTYKLPTLPEVEQYINENGHLPNVPSAKQVEEDGIEVGEMAKIQQEKIEELTLYAIQQQKQLYKQQKEIDELKAMVLKLAGTK